ncbi:MAG: molecular chaperone DnaJ [Acidobacteria bacterium]|nr:molecular chaperone DnaJ [Acidobacteriota bacterium]
MAKADYYDILGVARDADDPSLKSAYRKMAMKYHPDRNPGSAEAEEKFKEAAEAYSVLSDPQKRAAYDRYGHDGVTRASGGGGGGAGFDPNNFTDFQDVFGDLFSDFFGGSSRGGRTRVRRGEDLSYELEISFEDSIRGTQVEISVPRMQPCPKCDATGAEKEDGLTVCPTCRGRGRVSYSQGFMTYQQTCGQCGGSGQLIRRPCKECKGQRFLRTDRKLKVSIPAGVDTGVQMRVPGEGQPSPTAGGPAGDLYVVLRVREHAFFERHENDLHCTVPISVAQAALGAQIEVETFDGIRDVKIPEGTQPGTRFRLRGLGAPRINASGRGDLFVRVHVRIPEKLNKEQRKLFEQLRDAVPEDNRPREKGFFDRMKDIFS